MHPSANSVVFTWGKYKGLTLGYIAKQNSQYLHWMISADTLPDVWKIAAAKVLSGEDISELALPTAKVISTPVTEKKSSSRVIQLLLINKTTAAAIMPYDLKLIALFKYEVDGRRWNGDEKRWEFPAVQLPKAMKVFKDYDIKYDSNLEKLLTELKDRRIDLDAIRNMEDTKITIPDLKLSLYPYQNTGVAFIDRAGGRCLVADAPGLGKTIQALSYAQLHGLKTIIVCPLSVVLNWKKEINKFFGKDATIWDTKGHTGILKNQFHIVHYDAVGKMVDKLCKIDFDLLVCDEATHLKNRQTIRAKSILGSWKERKKYPGIKTKYCIFLTGTPVMSRPVEAFSLLNSIDKNRFSSFYHFIERYGGWRGAAPMNLKDLHDRTKDLVIRRKKEEVLPELPSKQRNELYVELTKAEHTEYQQLLNDIFGKWREAGKPSVQHMPKLQSYLIEKKLPRLIELIDEFLDNNRPILIFSCYLSPLKKLLETYGDKAAIFTGEMNKEERQVSLDRLINGEAKVGLFSLKAGGMGIDGLQKVMDTVVFCDMDWIAASHEQAEDRSHRIGQTNKVQVYYMICADTIDEYMRDILKEKQEIVSQIVDGESFQITANKSFFKEFVNKLSSSYKIDI
jgi:SWI/SNF-related matrix-associated actin-dependent regulator of chromatin subfamily A-like protein 1